MVQWFLIGQCQKILNAAPVVIQFLFIDILQRKIKPSWSSLSNSRPDANSLSLFAYVVSGCELSASSTRCFVSSPRCNKHSKKRHGQSAERTRERERETERANISGWRTWLPRAAASGIPWVAHNVCIEYVAVPSVGRRPTNGRSAGWCLLASDASRRRLTRLGPCEKKRSVSTGSTLRRDGPPRSAASRDATA